LETLLSTAAVSQSLDICLVLLQSIETHALDFKAPFAMLIL